MTMRAEPVLVIDQLNLIFPIYGGAINALNGVSLHVNRGEIVGVVGESGSGKSVTALLAMRLLVDGSYHVTQGSISLLTQDILALNEREMRALRGVKLSMIFQEPMSALNPTQRIGKQMMAVIRLHQKCSKRQAHEKAMSLLTEMQIPDPEAVLRRYSFELSGGMRQRILIAMAFVADPDLIIADEPTTALDVTVQREVLRLLQQKARARGTAVLFITHDMAVVSQLCDRVYVMYAGRVIESGTTFDVINTPAHPYSIGLLHAAPERAEPRALLQSIPGSVPNLADLPTGCAFRSRCGFADDDCGRMPELRYLNATSSQQVACWHSPNHKVGGDHDSA